MGGPEGAPGGAPGEGAPEDDEKLDHL
jgi:hypothetical protein